MNWVDLYVPNVYDDRQPIVQHEGYGVVAVKDQNTTNDKFINGYYENWTTGFNMSCLDNSHPCYYSQDIS